jgi:hypothetical protein
MNGNRDDAHDDNYQHDENDEHGDNNNNGKGKVLTMMTMMMIIMTVMRRMPIIIIITMMTLLTLITINDATDDSDDNDDSCCLEDYDDNYDDTDERLFFVQLQLIVLSLLLCMHPSEFKSYCMEFQQHQPPISSSMVKDRINRAAWLFQFGAHHVFVQQGQGPFRP